MQIKKLLSVLVALAMILSVLVGCADKFGDRRDDEEDREDIAERDEDNDDDSNENETKRWDKLFGNKDIEEDAEVVLGEVVSHSISVKSVSGYALEDVDVYIYADETKVDLKGVDQTDAEGNASVELAQGGDYAIILSDVPAGYVVEQTYCFNGTSAEIILDTALIPKEDFSGDYLGLGDVMFDFTVVDTDGNEVTLSQLLEEKDMVLINFFYTTCGPCSSEFPYMQEAYDMYQENVAVVALDPLDDSETVAAYRDAMGLTIPMASVHSDWSKLFGITGYIYCCGSVRRDLLGGSGRYYQSETICRDI